jgi:hypothetical protein
VLEPPPLGIYLVRARGRHPGSPVPLGAPWTTRPRPRMRWLH